MTNRLENKFTEEDLTAEDLNDTFEASPPVGSIVAWHKDFANTPSLPTGWAECNGQTLNNPDSPYDGQTIPNLNGENRFLRGNSSSGGTGGQSSHFHYLANGSREFGEAGDNEDRTDTRNNEPPYMDVVWVIKIV